MLNVSTVMVHGICVWADSAGEPFVILPAWYCAIAHCWRAAYNSARQLHWIMISAYAYLHAGQLCSKKTENIAFSAVKSLHLMK